MLGHGDQIPSWVRAYRSAMEHHDPPEPRHPIDPASWRAALGAFERAGDWEMLFQRELADSDWRDVLARWWPRLVPGLMSRLTHGLIRTAHAVRGLAATPVPTDAQLTELARGLAYWAARHTPLPGRVTLTGSRSVEDAVAALPRTPLPPGRSPAAFVGQRLSHLDSMPGYAEALGALAPDGAQALLSDMTAAFAGLCLAHPEINPVPLIHGVTAPAAARLVLPYLPQEQHLPTVEALWQAHVALLLAFTGDREQEPRVRALAEQADVPAWEELVHRAVEHGDEHGDEHAIKFTEASRREHALRPDPRYPAAVLNALERIPRRYPSRNLL
ncbi:questin oxidase family protein [Nonomuraea roseoviolacea subsp. roseoviolacea]